MSNLICTLISTWGSEYISNSQLTNQCDCVITQLGGKVTYMLSCHQNILLAAGLSKTERNEI